MIYKRLYQATAEKWTARGIAYHAVALYAHDEEALNAMFSYGFGMRCMDAVRDIAPLGAAGIDGVTYDEIFEPIKVRALRLALNEHLGKSPCFMKSSRAEYEHWLARAESRETRLFCAFAGEKIIAFTEIGGGGENFASEAVGSENICGAYCLPQYRGTGVYKGLIDFILTQLKSEGFLRLGVDFESINPTAAGFWLKYFDAYTKSVVRRIDECAIEK